MDLCRQYLHIKSGIGYVCIHNIHHLIYKVLIRLIDLYLPDRYQWFGVLQAMSRFLFTIKLLSKADK